MKTLTPTNLIAVEVPKDAKEVQAWNHGIGFKTKLINLKPDDTNGFYHTETGLFRWKGFEIIGEVTNTEISFDVEPYLDISEDYGVKLLRDYRVSSIPYYDELISPNGSFRSLLQSNGLYFENPIERPNPINFFETPFSYETEGYFDNSAYDSARAKWQSYESKLIKGKLIILKQK